MTSNEVSTNYPAITSSEVIFPEDKTALKSTTVTNSRSLSPLSAVATPSMASPPSEDSSSFAPQIKLIVTSDSSTVEPRKKGPLNRLGFNGEGYLRKMENVVKLENTNTDSVKASSNRVMITNPARKNGILGKIQEYFTGNSDNVHTVLPDFKVQEIDNLVAHLQSLDSDSAGKYTSNKVEDLDTLFNEFRAKEVHRKKSDLCYDLLVEHERGWSLFGYPFFNKSALIPYFDPPEFVNQYGMPVNIIQNGASTSNGATAYNFSLYPIDASQWEWKWDRWHVLMVGADVDDQGWMYSQLRFGSRHWTGKYRPGNNVRKRFWIRVRQKKVSKQRLEPLNAHTSFAPSLKYHTSLESFKSPDLISSPEKLLDTLDYLALDRHKIELIVSLISEAGDGTGVSPVSTIFHNKSYFSRMMNSFYFDESLNILFDRISKLSSPIATEFASSIKSFRLSVAN